MHTLQLSDGVLSLIDARLYSDNVYDGCARVVVHVADAFWLLLDTPPHDRQDIAAAWYGFQCDRGLDVHTADGGVCITKSDDALDVWIAHSDAVHSPQIFCGATEPVAGWVSPRYGERVAAPQLRFDVPADAMAAAFLVSLHADYAQARIVRHLQQNDGAHLVVLETRDGEEWLVYQPVKCKAWQLHDATLSFDGVLLWMRFGSSGLAELRWLGGTALSLPAYAVDIVLRGDKPADLAIGPQTTADEIAPSCARLQWPFCHRRD
ncbi:MAG: hypothetical protein KDJ24_13030 [Gammaproteobacteria bacterium]|nr:hypothetical protein [Gammaproteobacteria bacterium]